MILVKKAWREGGKEEKGKGGEGGEKRWENDEF